MDVRFAVRSDGKSTPTRLAGIRPWDVSGDEIAPVTTRPGSVVSRAWPLVQNTRMRVSVALATVIDTLLMTTRRAAGVSVLLIALCGLADAAEVNPQVRAVEQALKSLGLEPQVHVPWSDGSDAPTTPIDISARQGQADLTAPGEESVYFLITVHRDSEQASEALHSRTWKYDEPFKVGNGEAAFRQAVPLPVAGDLLSYRVVTGYIQSRYTAASLRARFLCGNLYAEVRYARVSERGYDYNIANDHLADASHVIGSMNTPLADQARSLAEVLEDSGACGGADRLPIVFLPGVAGTKLYKDSVAVVNELWPAAPLHSRLDLAMRLDGTESESGAEIVPGDIFRGPTSLLDFYGGLVTYLERFEYTEDDNLVLFPYDWRIDNQRHLAALDKVINAIRVKTGKEKVILIAHSMGGMIARQYLYTSEEYANKVEMLITLGTPHWGSPKVYYALLSGYTFGNPLVRPELMKVLMQDMPAAYQLMPWIPFVLDEARSAFVPLMESYLNIRYKGYERVFLRTLAPLPDSYTETTDNSWALNTHLIEQAGRFRALVGTKNNPKPLPAGVKHYAIIGHGTRTLGHFQMRDFGALDVLRLRSWVVPFVAFKSHIEWANGRKIVLTPWFHDGDGTVPMWGLETATATASYYLPTQPGDSTAHGDLANSRRVQAVIGDLIRNRIPDLGIEETRKTDPGPGADLPDIEGIDFTMYSDARLSITDSSGGRLGLASDGKIEETLSGGSFLLIDGVEYASVADVSRTYEVEINGIRDGKFSLVVDALVGNRRDTFFYPSVPVEKGTQARFSITANRLSDGLPGLEVTANGQHTVIPGQRPPTNVQAAIPRLPQSRPLRGQEDVAAGSTPY